MNIINNNTRTTTKQKKREIQNPQTDKATCVNHGKLNEFKAEQIYKKIPN